MKEGREHVEREIRRAVAIFVVGTCLFVVAAIASIGFSYYVVRHQQEHGLSVGLAILGVGGCLLLWEMGKAFRWKAKVTGNFWSVTEAEWPALFGIVGEVTATLDLPPVRRIYFCPDARAAVFVRPELRDLFRKPKRELVMGLGFLTQLDDEEIRAVLYHEFGHYAQREMRHSLSVYAVGQFSRSFVAIKEPRRQSVIEMQMKTQVLLFTYFAIWVCDRINRAYDRLAKRMEWEADDVAAKYVGKATLRRALWHAAGTRYNYEVARWGEEVLRERGIAVEDFYGALGAIGKYSRPTREMLPRGIVERIERLGGFAFEETGRGSGTVRQSMAEVLAAGRRDGGCSAEQFARWLREGFTVYAREKALAKAVALEVRLERRRHTLPFAEGKYRLLLDGKEIGMGNFMKGYTLKRRTSPGRHTLVAYAPSGIVGVPFEFEVEEGRSYRIEMDYRYRWRGICYEVFVEKMETV